MLGYIRESVQGWIAWAIVILLIIPFALWGINEYFGTGGPLVVANVNGEAIQYADGHWEVIFKWVDDLLELSALDPEIGLICHIGRLPQGEMYNTIKYLRGRTK